MKEHIRETLTGRFAKCTTAAMSGILGAVPHNESLEALMHLDITEMDMFRHVLWAEWYQKGVLMHSFDKPQDTAPSDFFLYVRDKAVQSNSRVLWLGGVMLTKSAGLPHIIAVRSIHRGQRTKASIIDTQHWPVERVVPMAHLDRRMLRSEGELVSAQSYIGVHLEQMKREPNWQDELQPALARRLDEVWEVVRLRNAYFSGSDEWQGSF